MNFLLINTNGSKSSWEGIKQYSPNVLMPKDSYLVTVGIEDTVELWIIDGLPRLKDLAHLLATREVNMNSYQVMQPLPVFVES